jgi:hypothetical protein
MKYDDGPKPIPPKYTNDNDAMIDFFMDYITHEQLGKIDNSHLATADASERLVI